MMIFITSRIYGSSKITGKVVRIIMMISGFFLVSIPAFAQDESFSYEAPTQNNQKPDTKGLQYVPPARSAVSADQFNKNINNYNQQNLQQMNQQSQQLIQNQISQLPSSSLPKLEKTTDNSAKDTEAGNTNTEQPPEVAAPKSIPSQPQNPPVPAAKSGAAPPSSPPPPQQQGYTGFTDTTNSNNTNSNNAQLPDTGGGFGIKY